MGDLVSRRLDYLSQGGPLSQSSFVAVIWCNIFLLPLGIVANAVGYWITVVSRKQCNGVNAQTLRLFLRSIPISFFFSWICFAFAPRDDSGSLGMAVFLFWPYFPALAGTIMIFNFHIWYSFLVTLLKYAFLRDGHSERVEQQP